MQYMRSLQFIQDRKNWIMNVLLVGVCILIPIIGAIVAFGYLFEMIESLLADPEHRDYRDFDFNRFTDYLSRGIWPFLARLVVSLAILLPFGIVYMLSFVCGGMLAKDAPALFFISVMVGVLIWLVGILATLAMSLPVTLQAGLTRGFDLSQMLSFAKQFVRLVRKELVMTVLFLVGVSLVGAVITVVTCFVGSPFVQAVFVMCEHHLLFQLYRLYLERGGSPIAAAVSSPPAATPAPGEAPDERFRAAP